MRGQALQDDSQTAAGLFSHRGDAAFRERFAQIAGGEKVLGIAARACNIDPAGERLIAFDADLAGCRNEMKRGLGVGKGRSGKGERQDQACAKRHGPNLYRFRTFLHQESLWR